MLTSDQIYDSNNAHQVWCVFETYEQFTTKGSGGNHRVPFNMEVYGIYENAKADLEDRLREEPHTVPDSGPNNETIYYHEHRTEVDGQLECIYTEGDSKVEIGDGAYHLCTIETLLNEFVPLPVGPDSESKRKMGANFEFHVSELEEMEAITIDHIEEDEE